jgi:hypothetical protein
MKLDWAAIVPEAARIVRSYDTGVTLRQLFYRLVSAQLIPNDQNAYKGLSRHTAIARRAGTFPDLIDRGRRVERYPTWDSPDAAIKYMASIYRRDRTEGQDYSIYLAVEKAGIVQQLLAWFGNLGIPILPLGGYSSQTFVDQVVKHVDEQGRPAILIYAGDFDPSGEDIDRDFTERTDCWDEIDRIALLPGQIALYNLPPLPGKRTDSRAAGFIARHGALMQVELDALPPDILRDLYQQAIDGFWDPDAYDEIMDEEGEDDKVLAEALRMIREGEIKP